MDSTQLKAQYKAGERNFKGVALGGANLVWFELKEIDLRGADLSHANLSGANLSEANLSDGANFAFADLSRTDLRNSNLKGTRLEGANLEGVQMEGALYNENTKFPIGFNPVNAGAVASGNLKQAALIEPDTQEKVDIQTVAPVDTQSSPPVQQAKEDALPERNTDYPLYPVWTTSKSSKNDLIQSLGQRFKDVARGLQSDWNQSNRSTDWSSSIYGKGAQVQQLTNTSGQGRKSVLPAELKGWNWGACLLPWLWITTNQVWGSLWIWFVWMIPSIGPSITMLSMIVFGSKGNEWAWKNRQWQSVTAFKAHQRNWAIASFILWGFYLYTNFYSKR